MTLALDGSVHGNTAAGTSLGVNLTTSGAGLIFVAVVSNGFTRSTPTASGLTFTKRGEHAVVASGTDQWETVYYAVSSGAVSALTITSGQANSAFMTVDAWGVSGADNSTIWDGHAGLPVTGEPDPLSITTDNANDFIYGAFRCGVASPTAGSGWTIIQAGDFGLTEYKIVSATQTALSVSMTTGSGGANGVVADAVIMASGSPTLTLQAIAGVASVANVDAGPPPLSISPRLNAKWNHFWGGRS